MTQQSYKILTNICQYLVSVLVPLPQAKSIILMHKIVGTTQIPRNPQILYFNELI